jgi:hypothetical protein
MMIQHRARVLIHGALHMCIAYSKFKKVEDIKIQDNFSPHPKELTRL